MDFLWWLVPAGFLAGFIDSIVGGGGAITLPALLATGMPAHTALGTNKLAASGASSMATLQYGRAGLLRARLSWPFFGIALGASTLGARAVLEVPERWILALVAAVIVAMVAYILLRPRFGLEDRTGTKTSWHAAGALAWIALIGFYDGFLGPGTGNLLLFGLVGLLGLSFLPAAAHGRVANFGSNLGGLALFAYAGAVDWAVGASMVGATMLGGFFGSRSGIRHGAKWIRPLFVLVALALLVRLVLR